MLFAPARKPRRASVPWVSGVVQSDRNVREIARQFGSLIKMPVWHAQVERGSIVSQQPVTGPPFWIVHRARPAAKAFSRMLRSNRLRPYPAKQRKRVVRSKPGFAFRVGEPHVADDRIGKAMLRVHLVQPSGLAHLVVAVVLGFDVNRLHNLEAGGVAPIVFRHIGAPNAKIVAQYFAALWLIREPRIIVAFEVP